MGMFDEIEGTVECINCKRKFIAKDQIKWTNNRSCHVYHVGDLISTVFGDGVYAYGSFVRDTLDTKCPYCLTYQNLIAVVEHGTLTELKTVENNNI